MAKTLSVVFIVIYDFIFLTIATSLGITATGSTASTLPQNVGISLAFLQDLAKTLGALLTFNVEGFPPVWTIILVYSPNLILILLLVKLIFPRD